MSPRLTAIGSGKGGTGKTLIATTLAQALTHQGERVLLCDADLGLANASVHLGLTEQGDLAGLLSGAKTLPQAVVRVSLGPRSSFDLLAAPSGFGVFANGGEVMAQKLMAVLESAHAYDRVLIDLGAGVDNGVMTLASRADETLLVLTPDPASLTDAYAFLKLMLRKTNTRGPRLLVNMALNATEGRRIAEALMSSSKAFLKFTPDYLGYVPFDARVTTAVRQQSPLLSQFPQAQASQSIESIARRLHGDAQIPLPTAGLR